MSHIAALEAISRCRVFLQGSWSEHPIWTMCSRTLLHHRGCVSNTWGRTDWGSMFSWSLLSSRLLISTSLFTWPLQQQQQKHRALCLSALPCWWAYRPAQDTDHNRYWTNNVLQGMLCKCDLWHLYSPLLALLLYINWRVSLLQDLLAPAGGSLLLHMPATLAIIAQEARTPVNLLSICVHLAICAPQEVLLRFPVLPGTFKVYTHRLAKRFRCYLHSKI